MKRGLGKIAVLILSALIVFSLLITGCGQSSGDQEAKEEGKDKGQDVIKIGVPTPLSAPGDYKAGEINVNTLKMARDEINSKGGVIGKKVELVIGDDQGNTSKGVSIVQKMINQDKVCAILGPWHGSVALAQAKICDENKIPIFLHYSWPDDITAMHSDYVFRVSPYNSEIAKLILPFIKEKGYQHVAVMAEDSSYGTGFGEAMKKYGEEEGIKTTVVVFSSSAMDLTPQLLDLKRANPKPDLLIVASVYQPMYLIPKQAYEVGLSPECQVMAGWDYPSWSEDFWKTVGEAGKGILYPSFYSKGLNLSPLGEKFKSAYKAKYNEDPPIYAYFLYDEFMMLMKVIEDIGSADPQEIAKALKDIEFEGTTGKITFEREDEPGSPIWNQWLGHQIFVMRLNNVGDMGDQAELVWSK